MNSSVRQPLSSFNSIERVSVHKQNACSISEMETFLKEIDRLQGENQKLRDKVKPSLANTMENQKLIQENQELKNQLSLIQHKSEMQEKSYTDAIRQLDINWKQDVATLKYQMEQQELNHRQLLRQEQIQAKSELTKLQSNLSKISNTENNNQNLVQVLENELITVKQSNNVLEEKLVQAIQQFDMQSKDQEFTLMKQQTVITSQDQYLNELKLKFQTVKDQNVDLIVQVRKLKELADNKSLSEGNLVSRVKVMEEDLQHVTSTYNEHKENLQQRVDELIAEHGKSQQLIALLQAQQQRDQELINRLQSKLDNEQKNREIEVNDIQQSKQKLIQFLQSELLLQKEANHQLRSSNQQLEQQVQGLQIFYTQNFRDLDCKTNMLEGECNRLNSIIQQKDSEILTLQMQNGFANMRQDQEAISETLQIQDQEINLLKQQNESLINDLSRQADNYRHLALQHKQYQKFAEDVKLNNVTINELQSKCELQDKEIERLRTKVLEKSQLLEKVQKDNLDYQAKLKSRLR